MTRFETAAGTTIIPSTCATSVTITAAMKTTAPAITPALAAAATSTAITLQCLLDRPTLQRDKTGLTGHHASRRHRLEM